MEKEWKLLNEIYILHIEHCNFF